MYPNYAREERIADAAMHLLGVIGAMSGAVVLIVWAAEHTTAGHLAAISIYASTLIATFAFSAMYHFTPWEAARPVLRRFDHAAIYLKIAGTYTPLVMMIGTVFAFVILGIVWALAIAGMVLKLFFWRAPGRFDPLLYLVMGWLSLFLVWSLVPILPTAALILIAVGGLLYSLGVIPYSNERLKYAMAIWHGFVVSASACFFAAIAVAAAALPI